MADDLEDLYREVILDHYKTPRNRGELSGDGVVRMQLQNPTCGDEIELSLRLEDGRIADVRFAGQGCSISMASASMLTEALKGKTRDEALELDREVQAMLRGEREADAALGDLQSLGGVAQFPVRVKCATLAWHALEHALCSTDVHA